MLSLFCMKFQTGQVPKFYPGLGYEISIHLENREIISKYEDKNVGGSESMRS